MPAAQRIYYVYCLDRQHAALVKPADDLAQAKFITRRLQAVDALMRVAEHALLLAKALEGQVGDHLLQFAQAREVVSIAFWQMGKDGDHIAVKLFNSGTHRLTRGSGGRPDI